MGIALEVSPSVTRGFKKWSEWRSKAAKVQAIVEYVPTTPPTGGEDGKLVKSRCKMFKVLEVGITATL